MNPGLPARLPSRAHGQEILIKSGSRISRTTVANADHAWSEMPTGVMQDVRALTKVSPKPAFVLLDVFNSAAIGWQIRDCISQTILATGLEDVRNSLEEIRSTLTIPMLGILSSDQSYVLSAIAPVFGLRKAENLADARVGLHKKQYSLPSHVTQELPDGFGRLYDFPSRISSIFLEWPYFDLQEPVNTPTGIPLTFNQVLPLMRTDGDDLIS